MTWVAPSADNKRLAPARPAAAPENRAAAWKLVRWGRFEGDRALES